MWDPRVSSTSVGVPGETSKPDIPQANGFSLDKIMALDPLRKENDVVSLAVSCDQEVSWVAAEMTRWFVGDCFLGEVFEDIKGAHINEYRVLTMIVGRSSLRKRERRCSSKPGEHAWLDRYSLAR